MSNDTFSERLAYPKGLKGIIANESALSDVRGEEGRLLYLGYDIDDLVEMCCFEEVVYLLLNKRLPNREELEGIKKRLRSDRDPSPFWISSKRPPSPPGPCPPSGRLFPCSACMTTGRRMPGS
jgi:citrate synthase